MNSSHGAETAAWLGALILAAILNLCTRPILCVILVSAAADKERQDLKVLFDMMAKKPRLMSKKKNLRKHLDDVTELFIAQKKPIERCRIIDQAITDLFYKID